MQFQGQELISRATRISSRTLVFASFGVLVMQISGFKSGQEQYVFPGGVKVPLEVFHDASVALIGFLMIAHFVNWYGDFLSYQDWNIGTKQAGSSRFDTPTELLTKIEAGLDMLDTFGGRLDNIWQKMDGNTQYASLDKIEDLKSRFEKANVHLQSISSGTDRLNRFARAALFGWFLLVPLVFSTYVFAKAWQLSQAPISEATVDSTSKHINRSKEPSVKSEGSSGSN